MIATNWGTGSTDEWKSTLVARLWITDFFSILLAVFISLIARYQIFWRDGLNNFEIFMMIYAALILTIWLLALQFTKSREITILGFGADEYRRVVSASALVFASIAIFSYVFKLEISRGFVAITLFSGLILLFISRRTLRRRLSRAREQGRYMSRVLLLQGSAQDHVESRLNASVYSGMKVVSRIKIGSTNKFNLEQISAEALKEKCDVILVSQSADVSAYELRKLGWALENSKIRLVVAPAVTEIAGPRLKVSNVEGLPLLHVEQPSFSGPARFTKRLVDIFGATAGLILLSPVFFLIAIVIKISDRGPVFYIQNRIRQANNVFGVYKFRTMVTGAHALRDDIMKQTGKDLRLAKDPNDPRITKPGKFLRRWSIDELPQLINVLKGEMSLVGPRPPLAEEVEQYESAEKRRLLVKPGLTGLWQVSGRSELDWEDAVRLDLYYVENWSLTLDFLIMLRTVAAVFRGEGAY
jgi:exopolysaccharide biosynthesis polyprenyl glycosylphosphotransferase